MTDTNVLDRLEALERDRQVERASRETLPTVPRTQAWYDCVEREIREAEERDRQARTEQEMAERLGIPEAEAEAARAEAEATESANERLRKLEADYRAACDKVRADRQAASDKAREPVLALEKRFAELKKAASCTDK